MSASYARIRPELQFRQGKDDNPEFNPNLLRYQSKYLAEQHLMNFTQQAWSNIDPAPFLNNWHLRLICELLMCVSLGYIKRLIINIPPRYSKSNLVSVIWPCWEWAARNPSQKWLFVSYVSDLSSTMSLKRRDLIKSEWYQGFWGGKVSLKDDRNKVADFMNTAKGAMYSTSTGGSVTGMGGNRIVIDDPTNPRQTLSEAQREQANEWYYNSLVSRLDDKINGSIVLIQQRLHQNDMSGYLTGLDSSELDGYLHQKNGWVLVRLPVIAECDEVIRSPIDDSEIHTVHEGDLLWAEREGPEQIAEHKRDPYVFSAQHQQRPSPKRGAIFHRDWFRYYDDLRGELKILPDTWVMSVDATFKKSDTSAYVTIGVWAWKKPNMYLDYQVREKMGFVETEEAIKTVLAAYPDISAKLIEEAANGAGIIDRLHTKFGGIISIPAEGSKESRASAVAPYFQAGNVWIKRDRWTPDYTQEMLNFPTTKYKDQVDQTTQAILYLLRTFGGLSSHKEDEYAISRYISWGR